MPRSTLARWMIELAKILRPIFLSLEEDLMASPVLLMDETPVQVLTGTGKKATAKNYMWVRCRSGPGRNIVVFNYDPSRSSSCASKLLSGFEGHLVTDGYDAYAAVISQRPKIVHCGCWDHARRRFFDAIKGGATSSITKSIAQTGMDYIQALYLVERSIKEATTEERYLARQEQSGKIMTEMKTWLGQVINTVPPKSLTGKALNYLANEWSRLTRFLDNGDVPISNALAENAIRPFAIGRKNWLFSATRSGAEASAILYSLIETAKANGIEPYQYLSRVIAAIPHAATAEDLASLLPYSQP